MALMGAVIIFSVRQVSDVNSQRSILLGLRSWCVTLIVLVGSQNIPLQAVPGVAIGFAATVRYLAFFSLEARQLVFTGHG